MRANLHPCNHSCHAAVIIYLHLNPFCHLESFEQLRPSAGQRRRGGSPLPPPDARQATSPERRSRRTAAPSEEESDHCPYQRNFFLSLMHQKRADRRGFGPSTAAAARRREPHAPGPAPFMSAGSASRFGPVGLLAGLPVRSRRLLAGGPRYRLCTWKGPQAGFGRSLPR